MAIHSEFSHKNGDFPELCYSLPEGINVPMQQDSMDSLLNETHHRRPKFDQRRFWGLFVLNNS
jgi:hypothetical protein